VINNNKYKYYLFDIYQLNNIIENDKIFTNLLENAIITYREDKNFKILEKIDNCYFIKFND
jgi:hypothetical protein